MKGLVPVMPRFSSFRQGKTNQFGRIEYGAFIRSKEFRICPFGMSAFYLFWRFQIGNEPFPDFTTSGNCFDVKLLKSGNDPKTSLDYKTHKASIDMAFKQIGLVSKAKTHAPEVLGREWLSWQGRRKIKFVA